MQPQRPTTHTKNGYTYQLDSHGRVTKVEGTLTLNKSQTRNQNAQKNAGGKDRLPDDQGGHFVGRRFDGPTDEMNHFAQNGNFNNSAYKKLENYWEKALKDNKDVRIKINPRYNGDSLRPDKVTIKQWIDGIPQDPITYANKHGG
ncbi:DNA/RNA non-specific endonuclease [Pseudomonas salmasensis]|uniref:DNA/RNA non-specific endonuclease n=1 Tax=Pseudomonas salmasensis TaxID=2745514 RepID=A0ABU5FC15_9PSED|nr:DNA/RNA non-specific endonuclease [Pseudomonas salmasensis]MDY4298815.1 DNA/RNA non-specific endonuclease [Pseudomonas salmasensis]